ncbi:Protein-L-isoaspartate(D-aspartate) O-methyltransferase [Lentibacillus sp. JNUCC-1]|uniref:protein-L-isoaspartate(D-aspartate) O-methyltransferase n=1 Tax=Lentibacillus sp. JNUCC-1 TaxID=2654513 RepID=UPI0012E8AA72|nr:protein-L-isoaspartate(D-aspartate) O-methyltransferase [Lentibacillus sp. JNUCC-1]MUV36955.1 Protein-L-isoaspartate(D-aspartate) O-methyltransferase [Lentibacillus sp. JNUCC-1]
MTNREKEIKAYFDQLNRRDFIAGNSEGASLDLPVQIGHGQTISQPTLALNMTIALQPEPGSKVLEIGTGSGYQTALLAAFSREVYTVERIEALYKQAQEHLHAKNFTNIHFKNGDGSLGWTEHAPYDRIMVTASATQIPDELVKQLAPGGKMIIPVGGAHLQELQMIEKGANGEVRTSKLEDVAFVRLRGKYE